ncbi:hypothetical protein BT67DRAFT_259273 [Trichocladium antarcticum]|uniref:3CxxC-type domain-containing protein n=1 Tax=Trichocladium antarcticum TaxID=1450529 RepID=A0AAN6ZF94_9PEZI|nr:hypothetical protein BT67DRAFT_259273 [Trichocladium antarcticum]
MVVARNKTAVMYPNLHDDVLTFLDGTINPEPRFNKNDETGNKVDKDYSTHIMGNFTCRNGFSGHCPNKVWGSKKIAIVIRRYPNHGYNALVFKQRCKSCNSLGIMKIDENSYIERVAYRLKKWAKIPMETLSYTAPRGPPHESHLCEGCKQGYCLGGLSLE